MPNLTEAQIKECELKFGRLPKVKAKADFFEYQGQTLGQKAVFWIVAGKSAILEEGKVPPAYLTEEVKLSSKRKDIREDLADVKKSWPGVRVYAVTQSGEQSHGHVIAPLKSETGAKMVLRRQGAWQLVPYKGNNTVGRADLAPSQARPGNSKFGIYTDSIGGCSAVAVLYGNRQAGLTMPFAIATLAHLAGSNPESVDWSLMYPNAGRMPSATERQDLNIRAVVYVDGAHVAGLALEALKSKLSVMKGQVTVYLSGDLSWCGVDHRGHFGITA